MKSVLSIIFFVALSSNLYAVQNKVYAVVNGEKITDESLQAVFQGQDIVFDKLSQDMQKNIIDKLIDQKILAQYALKSDIVNTEKYKETLNNLKQNLALALYMKNIQNKVHVTDKELKKYYEENKASYKQDEQYKARHILVKTKKEASDLIALLKKEKKKNIQKKFIELAKKYSTGPSGVKGGDLGWFSLATMVKEFSSALKTMKKNTFSQTPVQTSFGFHIIYLENKKTSSTRNFDEVKEKIQRTLSIDKIKHKIEKTIKKLKTKAKIKYQNEL